MIETIVHSFVTLFVTADPISIVPLFIVVTAGLNAAERNQVALRSVLIAGVILVAFALLGDQIIAFFGITIQAFEVAGGMLLFFTAFGMVFGSSSDGPPKPGANADGALTQIAVFPLAIPMMAGPGAISATILLSARAKGWFGIIELVAVILALMALIYAVLMMAGRIDRLLGDTGRVVVSKLLGVILAALAIQFIGDGVTKFAEEIAKAAA